MDHITSLIAAITLLFSPQTYTTPTATTAAQQTMPIYTICVDAGHGGNDPGALNADLTEAEVNLNIAKRLQKLLKENNYQVVMTRDDNETQLTNSERAEICNEHNADLLISIHLNSSTDTSMNYTQALYGDAEKDQAFASYLHEALLTDLGNGNPPKDAVTDFTSNLMLKADMPATLQETVFLSSPDEYMLLSDGTRQQQIAESLYTGINNWLHR